MDVSFSHTENYLAESPARLEETVQSLYADEQPKKRIRSKMETHSKLAETVGIENTIMLNPEDLAKVATRSMNEESMNRDYNKNFSVQTSRSGAYGHNVTKRRGPASGMRRKPYESSDSINEITNSLSTSLPETRTSVIRGMLNNRGKNRTENDAMSEDMEAIEYNNLRCYEQVDKDTLENFARHRHYLRDSDINMVEACTTKSDNATHVSENFSRVSNAMSRSFPMSSMETRPTTQPYFQQVRDAAYRVQQHPPEFVISQMDSRGKPYYERPALLPTQITGTAMIQKGYGSFNPKFNIQDGSFVQSHADMQSGYRAGYEIYENRTPASTDSSAKQNNLPAAEQDAFKANVKSYPSPIGKGNEEEKTIKPNSDEQETTNRGKSNERTDVKQLDDNKNIKGKRGAGGKGEANNQCAQCLKNFASSSALAKHKATHSDERKYICPICEKGFKRQDHLNGHMMTHRDKKPHECKYCDKSYCDHRSLKRHYENYHPNQERVQVTTSSASHKTETDLLSFVKPEGRFTPDREEGRPSPLSSQSKQEVPQGNFRRKRNSDSMCSNSSDDQGRRPDSHSPLMLFDQPQSAVSMLKQVIDSHEHKKEKHPLEGYSRQGYYPYPEGFNHQQWFHPYRAQMMKIMQLNQPPLLVQHNQYSQVNLYCPTDPPQLVPNYPPMNHNPSSHANEGTADDGSKTSGRNSDDRGYKGNREFVVPTDPTSIAIANAKDQQGDDTRMVQFTDGIRGFPHVVQWKTVSVGNDSNGMPPRSMGNSPGAMQLQSNMIVPDHKMKRERPTELNIHIPSSQAEKRPHEMVMTSEHQAKRYCPPPPSPASLNMAKEGLLKLADVSLRSENASNDDNIFKNPPSTPPRKPRPRPEPINISCSNLQFGGSVSPPIYTPPPMLSPHSIFHTPRCSVGTPLTPGRFFLAGNRSRKNSNEDESADVPSEAKMPEPKINIGPGFQAEVPSTTERQVDAVYDKHRAAVCWIPFEQETRKRAQEIEAFLDMACSVAVFGGGSNKEYALHVLYRLKGNIKFAVRHILANKSAIQKGDGLADYHYEGSERWCSKERLKFREALDKNGKNFYKISKEIKTKSVQQCVEFYYLWKACRPEGMRSRRGYAETESEPENGEDFSDDDSETTYVFECDFPECNSKFISRQALNGHIRVHGGSFMKPSEPKRTKVKATASSDSSASSVPVSTNVNRAVTKPPKAAKPPTSNSGTQPLANGDGTLPEFACKVCGRIFHKIKSRSAHMKTHVKRNDDDHMKTSKS